MPVGNAVCDCGDRISALLARGRNRHGSKAAVVRNIPVPYRLGIFRHRMAGGRYARLHLLDPAAHRAMTAFRQAVLRAGSCLGGIGDDGVALCGHLFLRHQNFLAHAAVFAFRLARFGAGSRNRSVHYFFVARGRDARCFLHDLAAGPALLFCFITIFCTGIRLILLGGYNVRFQMICFRDHRLFYDPFAA